MSKIKQELKLTEHYFLQGLRKLQNKDTPISPKKRRTPRCSLCKKKGHNMRTCKTDLQKMEKDDEKWRKQMLEVCTHGGGETLAECAAQIRKEDEEIYKQYKKVFADCESAFEYSDDWL